MAKKNNYVKINVEKIEHNKNGYFLFFNTIDEKYRNRKIKPILIEDLAAYFIKNKLSNNLVYNSIYKTTYDIMMKARILLKDVYIVSFNDINGSISFNVIIETFNTNDNTVEKEIMKVDDATALFLAFFVNDDYHIKIEESVFLKLSLELKSPNSTLVLSQTFIENEEETIKSLEKELEKAISAEDYIKAQAISNKLIEFKEKNNG